jgi:regulatory protein
MGNIEYTEVIEKLKSYCAYQERCEYEVLNKLNKTELNQLEIEKILASLKASGFLDNARFAEAFTSGKFKIKGWGKQKIRQGLKAKYLPEELIENALNSLDIDGYTQQLIDIANKKWHQLGLKKNQNTKQKLFRFLYGKGYESELINVVLGELLYQ